MNECPTQKSKLVKLQEGGKKILHFCFPHHHTGYGWDT